MQTAIQIDFQGTQSSEALRARIHDQVAKLEKRFGRITAGRVVVAAPGRHHRTGGLYEVHVRLALPNGREVDVSRLSDDDERFADPVCALNDAFRRARRQLQDSKARMASHRPARARAPIGEVVSLNPAGFGFLKAEDGRELYFHANGVLGGGFSGLKPGVRVAYHEERGENGPQASTIRSLGKHALR